MPFGSDNSALFWFFEEANWEIMVKVLDGCGFNRRFWFLAAASTNVEYSMTLRDTTTGQVEVYTNPLGRLSPAIADTETFAGCP